MHNRIFKVKRLKTLSLIFIISLLSILIKPLFGLIVLIFIFALFLPIKEIGLILRLIFSSLIYSSLLIISGILLYFLGIKFNVYIDLLILLILVVPAVIYNKKLDLNIRKLFPISELILLGIIIFTTISMGTYLVSQNSMKNRIEQIARGSDSISHLTATNEIYTLRHYIFSKSDVDELKYNFQGTNPYPEGVHYLTAQMYLFTDNIHSSNYQNIKRHLDVFLWANLIIFSLLIPLLIFSIYKFTRLNNWWILIAVFAYVLFAYYHYYQTLLMYGFYPNILGLTFIIPIIFLSIKILSNKYSNSYLIYLGLLIAALSFTYTLYLPPILFALYITQKQFNLDLKKINKAYLKALNLFIVLSIIILMFILLGEGASAVSVPGGIIQIPLVTIIPVCLISYYGYKKSIKNNATDIYYNFLISTVLWSAIIALYQLITKPHHLAYYYYKNIYLLLLIAFPLFIIGVKDIVKLLKSKKTTLVNLLYYVFILSISLAFYSAIEFNGNNFFNTNTYYFSNIDNKAKYSSSLVTGLNISNKTAYDIEAWIKNNEQGNIAFIDNCGNEDTFKSNRMAYALTLKGNWAMYKLSTAQTYISYGNQYKMSEGIKHTNKNKDITKYLNNQLAAGAPILLYIGQDATYLLDNTKSSDNQKINISNYYFCPNY